MSGHWRRGAIAALAQLGAGELLAAVLPRGRSPVSGMGQTLIDFLPGPSTDMVVATAENRDKALLRAVLAGATVASGRVSAGLEGRGRGRGQALLLGQALAAGAAAASRPENSAASSLIAGLGAGAAGSRALAATMRSHGRVGERALTAAGTLALAAAGELRRRQRSAGDRRPGDVVLPPPAHPAPPVPSEARAEVPGITPLFTPRRSFYVTDTVLTAPRVDPNRWRLRIRGLVERELELSLDDLLGMELVEVDATLVCVHNPVGGDRIGSARWLGVPLAALLDLAGVRAECDQVLTHSVTGFTAGLPLDTVADGSTPLVAVGMNGEALPVRHGFPARLLTPGIWGADANTKWLGAVELTTWDQASDYWDARGWPRVPGAVQPGSRIDVPADRATLVAGTAIAAGVAWAPNGGVEAVEVAIDNGDWRPAQLSPELAPTLWRQWTLPWRATEGPHELRVRTVARAGVQEGERRPPYPYGSSGYHTVRVEVEAGGALPRPYRVGLAQARADLGARAALAAMAPPAWLRHGFPGRPTFTEQVPQARRGPRHLLPSRPR